MRLDDIIEQYVAGGEGDLMLVNSPDIGYHARARPSLRDYAGSGERSLEREVVSAG